MDKIHVSSATASFLELEKKNIDALPTTLYFMIGERCNGACSYCTGGNNFLSRVRWPPFSLAEVAEKIARKKAGRICIQSLYYPGFLENILYVTKKFAGYGIPISVSMNPVGKEKMKKMKKEGVERIGIGLDCCSEDLFNKWKKNVPSWDEYMHALKDAKKIFGNATAHLIIGLGESDEEAIGMMKDLAKHGIKIALFAFTPVKMNMPPPSIERYRAMQLARYSIEKGEGEFYFKEGKLHKMFIPSGGEAFVTSGCPSCNRPFYNERASGPLYNYPRPMDEYEIKQAMKEVKNYARVYFTSP